MAVEVIFYIFAAMTIFGALMVISAGNPVKAALSVVFTFFSAAGVWITAQAVYLALLLVVVYVGAVMVMFLFVVMMLDVDVEAKRASFVRYWPVALLISTMFVVMLLWALNAGGFSSGSQYASQPFAPSHYRGIVELGMMMFSVYLYPFELCAMVMLAAMVSAITLTYRGRRSDNKAIPAEKQIRVDPASRLRVVKMRSESGQDKGDN